MKSRQLLLSVVTALCLCAAPVHEASAHEHHGHLLFGLAGAVIGTAVAVVTLPLAIVAPRPVVVAPPAVYYAPPAYYPAPTYYPAPAYYRAPRRAYYPAPTYAVPPPGSAPAYDGAPPPGY